MTEAEWLASTDPQTMLESIRGKVSERKLRLFAVACCRLVWHLLVDERSRKAVEVAERFADGAATPQELEAARNDAWEFTLHEVWEDNALDLRADALNAADAPAWAAERWTEAVRAVIAVQRSLGVTGATAQADLLRCVLGPLPFRPIVLDPTWLAWRGGTLIAMAEAIYEGRRFDCLPILGDALEDAGCTDPDILQHLRGPGPHTRGCWPVDLVLGKE